MLLVVIPPWPVAGQDPLNDCCAYASYHQSDQQWARPRTVGSNCDRKTVERRSPTYLSGLDFQVDSCQYDCYGLNIPQPYVGQYGHYHVERLAFQAVVQSDKHRTIELDQEVWE